jgi:hypothetical protein
VQRHLVLSAALPAEPGRGSRHCRASMAQLARLSGVLLLAGAIPASSGAPAGSAAAPQAGAGASGRPIFTDRAAESGLVFTHSQRHDRQALHA